MRVVKLELASTSLKKIIPDMHWTQKHGEEVELWKNQFWDNSSAFWTDRAANV